MKVTLDLPERDYDGHPGYEPDGSLGYHGDCRICGEELGGVAVRLHPIGWVHADACLTEAVTSAPVAWLAVAKHVAKYPSQHGASTLRAVITELAKLAEAPGNDDLSAETALSHLAAQMRELHYEVDGSPDREGSCIADGSDWPCPTMRAVYVTEAVKAGA